MRFEKSMYKNSMLICKLKKRSGDSFIVKGGFCLVGLNHSRYFSVAHVYYEQSGENNFLLTIEPRGQLSIKEILFRAFRDNKI